MKSPGLAIAVLFLNLVSLCGARLDNGFDTNSVIILNQNAWRIRNTDLEASKKNALEAIRIANKISYPRGLSYSYNVLGHYHKVSGRYDSAEIYYRKSLTIRQKLYDTIRIAQSYRNLMSIDKLLGRNKRAIETGLLVIQLLIPKIHDAIALKEMAWLNINIASLYDKTGDYDKAIYFASEGKTIFKDQLDEEGMAAAAINLGNIYESQKQYAKALKEYEFAIHSFSVTDNQRELAKAHNNIGNIHEALNNYPLALQHYKKSLEIRSEHGFLEDIKNSLHNIGFIFETLGRTDSAFKYYNQSLALSLQSGNIEGQYEAHRSLGAVLNIQKEYNKALWHLVKSLNLSSQSSALPEKIILLKEISQTYRYAGKIDSALFYTDEHLRLSDSLNETLTKSILMESNLKEKEYQLALSEEANKKQTIIIVSISTALGLILLIFLMYYLATQAKKRELHLKQIIKEKELTVLDAMLVGQQEERKRLAVELHDTIGSILSATKYAFKAMEKSIEKLLEENKNQYRKIDSMLDEAMESVRRISHNMSEGILTEKGLEGVLMDLCDTLKESGKIKFTLTMHGFDRRMDYTIESNLYRIVQELMTNVIKHSQAQNVNIQLIKSKDNINLIVEDDGKGFKPEDPTLRKGIGLSNIDGRVEKLSGKWNIDSGKGRGTTIVIDIPLNEEV